MIQSVSSRMSWYSRDDLAVLDVDIVPKGFETAIADVVVSGHVIKGQELEFLFPLSSVLVYVVRHGSTQIHATKAQKSSIPSSTTATC
jgi:hypothetical protein